jgi:CheY-like chemotaxis protein
MNRRRVFIADDDDAILDALQLILSDRGYRVTCSTDGREIFKQLANPPDVFLLDIWMSGVDGTDICLALKSDEETKNIPVILVSAHQDIAQIAQEAGADAYLVKPFEMSKLLELLQQFGGPTRMVKKPIEK